MYVCREVLSYSIRITTPTKTVDRAIKVAVLEGDFAAICGLGLPFSLSLQLQSSDLKLSEAMWTAKSSSSGFSIGCQPILAIWCYD